MFARRKMLGLILLFAGCGGAQDNPPSEAAQPAADQATEGIGPRCRELIDTAQRLVGSEPVGPISRDDVKLSEASCLSVLHALATVEPSMRGVAAVNGLMFVFQDAGFSLETEIEAMKSRGEVMPFASDTPLPAADGRLPQARGQFFYLDNPFVVRIDARGVTVGGSRFDPTEVAGIRSQIDATKQNLSDEAATRGEERPDSVALHIDAVTAFGAVADVMRACAAADILGFQLAVRHEGGLRATNVSAPLAWAPPDPSRAARVRPKAQVRGDKLSFAGKPIRDLAALTEAAAEHIAKHPGSTEVGVFVARDVPMQRVAEVLDALRDCVMDEVLFDNVMPPGCKLWNAVLSDG